MKQLAALTVLASLAAAHAGAQVQPPVRPLGAVVATSRDTLGNVAHLRALPGGRLLVNDVARRRVVLLDSTLAVVRVVADSTSGTAEAYGQRPGGLIAYKGDSTLFVDPASLSMLVIDGAGAIARVMSVPRAQEVNSLTSISFGAPSLDAAGRLVYRAFPGRQMRMAGGPDGPGARGGAGAAARAAAIASPPDSAAIVRLDLATRTLDTAAFIRIPRVDINVNRSDDGQVTMSQTINPLPVVDEWVVTSAGTLAIVRGRDYRIEWPGSDAPGVKIPFEWQRLSDEDKVALIDSVKAQRERMTAQQGAAPGQVVFGGAAPAGDIPGGGAAGAPMQMTIIQQGPGGGGAPARGNARGNNMQMNIGYVAPSELPDYKPPFFAGAARADADGNIWVRTIPTRALGGGGPVYDVIDAKGTLVDRVQVPARREIRGFGPGGIVYLVSRSGGHAVLEAARLR